MSTQKLNPVGRTWGLNLKKHPLTNFEVRDHYLYTRFPTTGVANMEGGGSSKFDWGEGGFLIKGGSFDKKIAGYKPASHQKFTKNELLHT